ncbi:MAG: helix-turn-helix domain-containing protein [Monoglobales bacterium]
MADIHERIKQRRTELGYTLLYVAEQLNIKEATMQRYESGAIKNIKHQTITKLSQILKCDPAYLMGWTDSPIKIQNEYEKLYLQLDAEDRAEIRGEIKHMLKAPKYNKSSISEDIAKDFKKIVDSKINTRLE